MAAPARLNLMIFLIRQNKLGAEMKVRLSAAATARPASQQAISVILAT
jgi:hypothetical protein